MNRAGYTFWEAVEVRWSDMDALGHVNNTRYFTYLESARIHLFESLGLHMLDHARRGVALVSVTCNFRKQVRYPATVEIGTRVVQIGTSSFHLEHGFFLEGSEELVADSRSVVVTVDYAHEKSVPMSEALRERLQSVLQVP